MINTYQLDNYVSTHLIVDKYDTHHSSIMELKWYQMVNII